MISCLEGIISHVGLQTISITLHGITFEIYTSQPEKFIIGQSMTVQTYVHWHQEQGPQLFGFTDHTEKTVFQLLLSCPGIGPKLALGMLAHTHATIIIHALYKQETTMLSSIPGIGKKKAEQLILSLKDKVEKIMQQGIVLTSHTTDLQKISEVLSSLDYTKQEINAALNYIKQDEAPSFDAKLRKILSFLSK